MNKNLRKVAIIFHEISKGISEFEGISIVEISRKGFKIVAGDRKDYINSDFKRLLCKGSILDCNKKVLVDGNKSSDLSIYIFDKDEIKKIKEDYKIDNSFNLYTSIATKASYINISKENHSYFTRKNKDDIPVNLCDIIDIVNSENDIVNNENDGALQFIELDLSKTNSNLPSFLTDMMEQVAESSFGGRERTIDEENIETEEEISETIDVDEIISKISSKIVCQEETIESLVSNIYFNQMLIDKLTNEKEINNSILESTKVDILLDGESGTGKTAIVKQIAKMLDIPMIVTSSTNFTETGYVGSSITDLISKLIKEAKGNVEKAERGIILFDEIDKIATKNETIGKDLNRGVQEEMLTFIGGGEYDIKVPRGMFYEEIKFNTNKITFILAGAFTSLKEQKIKENEKTNLGFSTKDQEKLEKTYVVEPQDYIDYGLIKEFFARIKVLLTTKSYTLEDYKKILLTSAISPLRNFEMVVKMFGYPGITFDESFINKFAKEAEKMNMGARSLQTIMSGIQTMLLPSLRKKEFDLETPIKLDTSLLEDYKKVYIRKY